MMNSAVTVSGSFRAAEGIFEPDEILIAGLRVESVLDVLTHEGVDDGVQSLVVKELQVRGVPDGLVLGELVESPFHGGAGKGMVQFVGDDRRHVGAMSNRQLWAESGCSGFRIADDSIAQLVARNGGKEVGQSELALFIQT